MSGPEIILGRKSGAAALDARLKTLSKLVAYVGVPASSSRSRKTQLLSMATAAKGTKKRKRLEKAAESDLNNAETLFLLSKGSPLRNQPPRPVLEPAIQAEGNRQGIAAELAQSVKANLAGDKAASMKSMQRAALAGQNAARKWFTDPRNNWAPNAPSTIARKGSDRPGIDTGATRAAIVGIVGEE